MDSQVYFFFQKGNLFFSFLGRYFFKIDLTINYSFVLYHWKAPQGSVYNKLLTLTLYYIYMWSIQIRRRLY